MNEFKKLGLSENILNVLEKKGFEKPTLIREKTIPLLLEGNSDIIGQSQTGTGKTACFSLPIIERADEGAGHVQALILTPTRELAIQVTKDIDSFKGKKNLRVLTVYGGSSISDQISKLKKGIDVVVGTPGRVIDLLKRRKLDVSNIDYAVLDEADEMLNMGFLEDIKKVLSQTNPDKRMIMFSATMPREIMNIAKKFMKNYTTIEVEKKNLTIELTDQFYYDIQARDRFDGLRRVIDINTEFYGIVFCKTKAEVDSLAHNLIESDYNAAALHGDISQAQREKILGLFRKKKINILIATDVAARGIDVNDLTHVINYSLPQSPESYVHRIGRTGRAGKKGIAITFLIPSEKRKLKFIERIVNRRLEKRNLPSVKDIIETKKNQLRSTINQILEKGKIEKFESIAKDLLEDHDPEKVVASLIKFTFKDELNPDNYKSIKKVAESSRDERRSGRREKRGGRGRRDGRGDRGSGRRGSRRDGRSGRGDSRRDGRSGRGDSRRDGRSGRGDGRGDRGRKDRKSEDSGKRDMGRDIDRRDKRKGGRKDNKERSFGRGRSARESDKSGQRDKSRSKKESSGRGQERIFDKFSKKQKRRNRRQ